MLAPSHGPAAAARSQGLCAFNQPNRKVSQLDDDPVEAIARAAAKQLAPEYGPKLEVDVEAALYMRDSDRGPEQFDPVSIGVLIVSIATLAWMIYSDHRKKAPSAAPEVIERAVRSELRRQVDVTPEGNKISEVVVTEIVETLRKERK